MSYRVCINDCQIFGNNESYFEWDEYIKSLGIEIDGDGCYEGEITDFMEMLLVIEKITLRLEKERIETKEKIEAEIKKENLNEYESNFLRKNAFRTKSIFDMRHIYEDLVNQDDDKFSFSLFDKLCDYVHNGYMFMPYAAYLACQDIIEPDKPFRIPNHFNFYKLKEGKTITVSAR